MTKYREIMFSFSAELQQAVMDKFIYLDLDLDRKKAVICGRELSDLTDDEILEVLRRAGRLGKELESLGFEVKY